MSKARDGKRGGRRAVAAIRRTDYAKARARPFDGAQGKLRVPVHLAIAFVLTACGYHLAGTQSMLPSDVHSLSVGEITNHSREFGLEKSLAFALEREVYARGQLLLVEAPGVGDAVLSGTIRSFSIRPVAFDARDEAIEYEAELRVDLKLRRQADGKVLWQASGLAAQEDYSVRTTTVITSSSQFQRGTINATDLQAMTDIQLAETEKRLAIERLLDSVVRDAHERMLEDF